MITYFIVGLVVGLLIGAGVTLAVSVVRGRLVEKRMREAFAALASEALDANSRRLAEQTGAALEGKRQLIDRSIAAINERLEQVRQFVQRTEADRKQDFGRLSGSVTSLAATTGELHKMLASTQRRGAWGERMAEDILRLAGLQEGVNYLKQSTADAESGRADFTFLLPNDLKVNMDVKFPLENYKAYVDAETDEARDASLDLLVKAVRRHIRDVAGRGYVDPDVPTVPYVIVFIPSEQIHALVLESQGDLIDEALKLRVVLASPLTLYAMLSVIRQAAENFNVMQTADEVIQLLGAVEKQWQRYKESMDLMGKRLDDAKKEYDKLVTTRTRMLDRPLEKIEDLRQTRGLPEKTQDEP